MKCDLLPRTSETSLPHCKIKITNYPCQFYKRGMKNKEDNESKSAAILIIKNIFIHSLNQSHSYIIRTYCVLTHVLGAGHRKIK
jgi:hypothetical protein